MTKTSLWKYLSNTKLWRHKPEISTTNLFFSTYFFIYIKFCIACITRFFYYFYFTRNCPLSQFLSIFASPIAFCFTFTSHCAGFSYFFFSFFSVYRSKEIHLSYDIIQWHLLKFLSRLVIGSIKSLIIILAVEDAKQTEKKLNKNFSRVSSLFLLTSCNEFNLMIFTMRAINLCLLASGVFMREYHVNVIMEGLLQKLWKIKLFILYLHNHQ